MTSREIVTALISSIHGSNQLPTNTPASNPLKDAPQETQKALLTLHVLFPNEFLTALDLLDRNLITRLKPKHGARQSSSASELLPVPSTRGPLPGASLRVRQEDASPQARDVPTDLRAHGQREDESQMDQPDQADLQTTQPQRPHHHDLQDLGGQDQPLRSDGLDARQSADAAHGRQTEVYVVRSSQIPARVRAVNQHTPSYEVRLDAWSCSCPAFAFVAFPAATSDDNDIVHDIGHHDSARNGWNFGGLTLGNDMPVCKHLLACALVEHSSAFASCVEERDVSVEELAGWAAGWGD